MARITPATTAAPDPEESPTLGPLSSPAHLTGTPPSASLAGSPLCGHSPMMHHFFKSAAEPHRKSGTTLPVAQSAIIVARGPMLVPKKWRFGVNTATKTCPNWYKRLDPALNNKGRSLLSPFQSNQGHH